MRPYRPDNGVNRAFHVDNNEISTVPTRSITAYREVCRGDFGEFTAVKRLALVVLPKTVFGRSSALWTGPQQHSSHASANRAIFDPIKKRQSTAVVKLENLKLIRRPINAVPPFRSHMSPHYYTRCPFPFYIILLILY